jgi:hypothetical protein
MKERCGFRFKSRGSRFNAHREVEADTTERAATVRLRWEEVKIQACFFVVDVFEVVKAKQSKAKERKLAIKDAGMEWMNE